MFGCSGQHLDGCHTFFVLCRQRNQHLWRPRYEGLNELILRLRVHRDIEEQDWCIHERNFVAAERRGCRAHQGSQINQMGGRKFPFDCGKQRTHIGGGAGRLSRLEAAIPAALSSEAVARTALAKPGSNATGEKY